MREPCKKTKQCADGGACRKGACHYSLSNLPTAVEQSEESSDQKAESEEEEDQEKLGAVRPPKMPSVQKCRGRGCRLSEDAEEEEEKADSNDLREEEELMPLSEDNCEFRFQCSVGKDCKSGVCVAVPESSAQHLPGRHCSFSHECPESFDCRDATCVKGTRLHLVGRECAWTYQCPTKFVCDRDEMSCYAGGQEHRSARCRLSSECEAGESCQQLSCLPN